jgi:hypothetical protein
MAGDSPGTRNSSCCVQCLVMRCSPTSRSNDRCPRGSPLYPVVHRCICHEFGTAGGLLVAEQGAGMTMRWIWWVPS